MPRRGRCQIQQQPGEFLTGAVEIACLSERGVTVPELAAVLLAISARMAQDIELGFFSCVTKVLCDWHAFCICPVYLQCY